MSNEKKKMPSLGRGLESIFGEGLAEIIDQVESKTSVKEIPMDSIELNPMNPRRFFSEESLKELSESIKSHGLIFPIIVSKNKDKYLIVAGERRFRASQLANRKFIDAIVINVDDKKMQEIALIENIQREDLNPIEEAIAIQKLISTYNITHEQVANVLKKSRSYISNSTRLLKLDKEIVNMVLEGKLSYGHVRPLINLPKEIAIEFATKAIKNNLTVREIENFSKGWQLRNIKEGKEKKIKTQDYIIEQNALQYKLKTEVKIDENWIKIKFKDNKKLEKILRKLGVK